MSENPYQAPLASTNDDEGVSITSKPSPVLITITVLLVLINAFLSFTLVYAVLGFDGSYGTGYAFGFILGRTFFIPLVIVALFQIGKRFRNTKSRTNIFMWSSVVVLLSLLGNIGSAAQG